ncbi:MAG: fasciclin domain-containing protein [Prolixibacteraceae bacterium]|nr:fasciclin domain-containing protein [Prolixibacteraceae bacterium]
MKNTKINILLSGIFFFTLIGCEKYFEPDKFKRPEWLPGKLYTTVSVQEDLSMFTECIHLSGLDTIIDVSGSWSVFAPNNEAMKHFLSENHYAAVTDIPKGELEKIVEFHIVQNPWTLEQLQSLAFNGWRAEENTGANSFAYKRQTIFKNPVEKYWIKRENNKEMIVIDSVDSDASKRVYVESRKYVPIFYDGFMHINGLSSEDFRFYFDRDYEQGNVYYAGAKILQADIIAENGFVHVIDKVVDPMLNGREMLEREIPGETYKRFLELVYWYYPDFEANMLATFNQPEVRRGGLVDTLWDLNYSGLNFALQREVIGYIGGNVNETLVRHNGLYVPTDNAFSNFIDGILTASSGYPHWADSRSLPVDVADMIVSQHFKSNAIYPSTNSYREIFREIGNSSIDEGDIIRREFGSNCTFIGLDKYIPNPVFTSVTGPVFCRPTYSIFRRALIYSGSYNTIANYNGDLYFFVIPDNSLIADSALIVNWINKDQNNYNIQALNRITKQVVTLGRNTLRNLLLNQVGTSAPNGSAEKEFIRTLAGNYITWDHTDNTIQGTYPCTIGYNGIEPVTCHPTPLEEPADNGKVYSVRYWFNFGYQGMLSTVSEYSEFYSLLDKAGLVDEESNELIFLDKNEKYTVFIPSDEALIKSHADTLSGQNLQKFLKYHFLKGELIFTDNKQSSGYYKTASGELLSVFTGPDIIKILDNYGNPYISIPEKENSTNIMISEDSEINSVIHEINDVLVHY